MLTFSFALQCGSIALLVLSSLHVADSKSLYSNIVHSLPGTFSWFHPRLTESNVHQSAETTSSSKDKLSRTDIANEFGQLTGEEVTHIVEHFDASLNASHILEKLLTGSHASGDKHRKYILSNGHLVISLANSLIGWKNYAFRISRVVSPPPANLTATGSDEDDSRNVLAMIELTSTCPMLSGEVVGYRRIRMRLRLDMEEGDLVLTSQYGSKGMTARQVDMATGAVGHYLKTRLRDEIKVAGMRKKQLESNRALLQKDAVDKRRRHLDRVLHPEKHRSKSPSVRIASEKKGQSGQYIDPDMFTRSKAAPTRSAASRSRYQPNFRSIASGHAGGGR